MYNIGVDLGGTNIAIGIVNENNEILIKGSTPTLSKRPTDEIVKDMADLSRSLCEKLGITLADISYVGIAAPGTIDSDKGLVVYSNNIPMDDYPMVSVFSGFTGIPTERISIGNDANLAALGEYIAGAAAGHKSAVMITLGTGVGGGIVLDGKVITGCVGGGAELGHMVIQQGGRPCTCGRKGCFEAYSSATALIRMTKEKFAATTGTRMHILCENDIEKVGGKTAFAAMKLGDAVAKEVVDEYIDYLACGIANLINIFQPEIFIIGGGVCNEKENLTIPLFERVAQNIFSKDHVLQTEIRIATLGNDAGIIGAPAFTMSRS